MTNSVAICSMIFDGTNHAYQTTSRIVNSNELGIVSYGDILVSLKLFTESKLTNLSDGIGNIQFKHIGPGFVYLIENQQNLTRRQIISNTNIISYSCLWLFVEPNRRKILIDSSIWEYSRPIRKTMYRDICRMLDITYPQTPPLINKSHIATMLNDTAYLPTDITDIIADYYSPYKCDYHIEKVELKEGRQEYTPINPLKVVAIQHPKNINIDILFVDSAHILPNLDSVLTTTIGDDIVRCMGPCDTSFSGYDPEKDNVRYIIFKKNKIEIYADKPTSISLICLN